MARRLNYQLPEGAAYYRVDEVAGYLRLSKMTVYRMIHNRQLPVVTFGGRSYRIPADLFREWEVTGKWGASSAIGGEPSEARP